MISLSHNLSVSRTRFSPLCFLCVGFLPVTSIVLHCLGILPLQNALFMLILPLLVIAAGVSMISQGIGRVAFRGWLSGIVAVFLYDISRIPFVMAGWEDFIPKIGSWLLHDDNRNAMIGYAWRYIGNGGG